MKRFISSAIAAVLLGATSSAFAYDGFATDVVNLRAGPDTDYPVVTVVPAGAELSIQGCTEGYQWCDVVFDDARGWVAGSYVQYEYNDQPVPISGYGARIGVPIVGFVIGDYWGSYYRNRPFWVERDRWYSRPYVFHSAPVYRGAFHDWGHDRSHYNGGNDHGHGYAGHGYNGGSHAPEYHGNAHGSPEYHGGSHNDHVAPQQYNAQQNHGYSQHNGVPQNHGNPQQQNAGQNHAYQQQQNAGQNHAYQQQQGHGGGAPQPHPQGANHVQAAQQQQVHTAPAPQQHGDHSSSHDKKDHDHDHGH